MKRTFNLTLLLLSLFIAPVTMNAENGDGPCGVKLSTNGTDITLRLTSEDWGNNQISSELNNTSKLNGYDLGNLRTLELKKGIYVGWASGNDYYNETSFKIKYCVYKEGEDTPEMTEYIALDHQAYHEGNDYRFESTLANPIDLYALTNYEPGTYKLRMQMCEHKYWDNGTENGSWNADQAAVEATFVVPATHYIAGSGLPGINWDANSIEMVNNTITFQNVEAGWYECKVTDGTWTNTWGYNEVDAEHSTPSYQTYSDNSEPTNNICFRTYEAGDVTISFANNKVRVTFPKTFYLTGNAQPDSQVDGYTGNWCAGQNWITNYSDNALSGDPLSISYAGIPTGEYRFRITDGSWTNTWGYTNMDATTSSEGYYSGSSEFNNVIFYLHKAGPVTISFDHGKISLTADLNDYYYVAGNGSAGNPWCGGKDWWKDYEGSQLNTSTHDITFENVPAGTYEFKVTDGTWGDGHAFNTIDTENSDPMTYMHETNISFQLDAPTNVTIGFDPSTGKVTVNGSRKFVRAPYSLVGDEAITGHDWATHWGGADKTATDMTFEDGLYRWTYLNAELTAGTDYKYKVASEHSWNIYQYPNTPGNTETNNKHLSVTEDGIYDLRYTFDPQTETLICTAHKHMNFTISSYGYNTFFYDKAYEIPEGVTAKIVTDVNASGILTYEAISVIPANTGVLLSGTPGDYTFLETTTTDSYATTNKLKGSVSETDIDNSLVHYVLSYDENNQVGFFWPYGTGANNGVGSFTNGANKAYLELGVEQQSSNVIARRGFPFNPQSELPTSVETVSGERLEVSGKILRDGNLLIIRDGRVYNAQGARMK